MRRLLKSFLLFLLIFLIGAFISTDLRGADKPAVSKIKKGESQGKSGKTKPPAKPAAPAAPIDYNFQVRPILAANCFKCHGADEKTREAKLRLDLAEPAYEAAITQGKPDESELIKRIFTTNEDDLMPPPDSHLALKDEEKAILRQWITEGARYDVHWAFKPLIKPPLPSTTAKNDWVRQEMDAFVLETLKAHELKPAEPADREHWLKRVSMDLTGLPPTLAEIDAFLKSKSPNPYHEVVDRLLASPHYGERMALDWLDSARYADSFGRHEDADSENFPCRDWAIRVFNQNLPYDKFVEWQIGGDMLPQATVDQQLATAFNRLHPQSNESGSDEDEFRCDHVADRVKTTATALLGLTMECAKCHDHKYDPISMKDYYSFGAFLNNIDEQGLFSRFTNATPTPAMFLYKDDEEARHESFKKQISDKVQALQDLKPAAKARFQQWLAAGNKPLATKPSDHLSFEGKVNAGDLQNVANPERPMNFKFVVKRVDSPTGKALFLKGDQKITSQSDKNDKLAKDHPELRIGDFHRSDPFSMGLWLKMDEDQKRAVIFHHTVGSVDAACRGYEFLVDEMRPDFCLAHFWPGNAIRIRARDKVPVGKWTHLLAVYDGTSRAAGMHIYMNGVELACDVIADCLTLDLRYEFENGDLDPRKVADAGLSSLVNLEIGGRRNDSGLINASLDDFKVFDRALSAVEVRELAGLDASKGDWFDWYLREIDPQSTALAKDLHLLLEEECDFTKKLRTMMVMREHEGERRKTFVLNRGQFNQPGEEVQPDAPASILPWPPELPRDRSGLAKWFTHPKNPLTVRVAVNRYWQIFFGKGLVATPEDFGIQGALPSHPALLDWLACDFRENGWDVKRLCRMIVLSATYRQSIKPQDPATIGRDPDNRLLARGPHHRWQAEQIRDQALAVSGLLVRKIGGPSVFPYQPAGLWEDSGTQHVYKQDHGENLYRRSMYSFWRRTMPPASMSIFDAPTREYCRVRRERTNTPLQALALLNDPQLIECTRILAEDLIRTYPQDKSLQLQDGFRRWTGRTATKAELATMDKLYAGEIARYESDPAAAQAFLEKNGEHPSDPNLPAAQVVALSAVQRVLLNSAEVVLKF